jgi:hypothetical protein
LWRFPQIHRAHHNNKLYSCQKLVTALVVTMMIVEKRLSASNVGREGAAIPSLSTGFAGVVGFILCEKASTVRQR